MQNVHALRLHPEHWLSTIDLLLFCFVNRTGRKLDRTSENDNRECVEPRKETRTNEVNVNAGALISVQVLYGMPHAGRNEK